MSLALNRVSLGDDFSEVKGGVVGFFVVNSPDLVADSKRDFVCKLVLFSVTGLADLDSVSIFGRVVARVEIFPSIFPDVNFSFRFVLAAYLSDSFGVVPTSLMDGVLMALGLLDNSLVRRCVTCGIFSENFSS